MLAAGVIFYVCKSKLQRYLHTFFESPDKDTPSPFALLTKTISSIFAAEVVQNAKSMFMGVQSVENKNERKDAIEEAAGGNPLISTLLASFPSIKKRLMKNSELGGMLLNYASQALNKKNSKPVLNQVGNVKSPFSL